MLSCLVQFLILYYLAFSSWHLLTVFCLVDLLVIYASCILIDRFSASDAKHTSKQRREFSDNQIITKKTRITCNYGPLQAELSDGKHG